MREAKRLEGKDRRLNAEYCGLREAQRIYRRCHRDIVEKNIDRRRKEYIEECKDEYYLE